CYKITTVFSHAQTVVLCVGCSTVLCQPTGGKARLTEGRYPGNLGGCGAAPWGGFWGGLGMLGVGRLGIPLEGVGTSGGAGSSLGWGDLGSQGGLVPPAEFRNAKESFGILTVLGASSSKIPPKFGLGDVEFPFADPAAFPGFVCSPPGCSQPGCQGDRREFRPVPVAPSASHLGAWGGNSFPIQQSIPSQTIPEDSSTTTTLGGTNLLLVLLETLGMLQLGIRRV
ncbi:hypothetical protein DV515_00017149, partial [Chloebia gouldiae]